MTHYRRIVDAPCIMKQGEKLLLGLCAAMLAPQSTVVEVGTFLGASASILHQATRGSCTLYSLDTQDIVNERLIAKDQFHFFPGNAAAFAKTFQGRIDLLFIDGDHSFKGAYTDYLTLRPFLAPEAVVIIHDADYDHLGVKFFCDTLVRIGGLRDVVLESSMLVGIHDPDGPLPTVEDFARTLRDQALGYDNRAFMEPYRALAQASPPVFPPPEDLSKVRFIGRGSFGQLVRCFYDLPWRLFMDSTDARDPECIYYLCCFSKEEVERTLVHLGGISPSRLRYPNPFHLSRIIYDDLTENGGKRLAKTATTDMEKALIPGEFLKLSTALLTHMHDTGYLHQFFSRFFFMG